MIILIFKVTKSNFFVIFNILKQKNPKIPGKFKKKKEYKYIYMYMIWKAFEFYARYTKSVEILRGEELEKTYFIVMPFCTEVHKESNTGMRNKFFGSLNLSSTKSKFLDLIKKSEELIEKLRKEET